MHLIFSFQAFSGKKQVDILTFYLHKKIINYLLSISSSLGMTISVLFLSKKQKLFANLSTFFYSIQPLIYSQILSKCNTTKKYMDYVRHGEIQGRYLVFFKGHGPVFYHVVH